MDIERSEGSWLRRLGFGGVAAGVVLAVTGVVVTPSASAPGNNGTIKVDEQGLENGPGAPNSNDPHIDCAGRVEWYGFDEGVQSSDVTFEVQAPTSSTGAPGAPTSQTYPDVPIVDGDGPGGTSLDGTLDFDLSTLLARYQPHPQQGYHVKVTAHTTFSQGSDVKHKVFWVRPCAEVGGGQVQPTPPVVPPVPPQQPVTPPGPAAPVPEVEETPSVQPEVQERPSVQPTAQVQGAVVTRPAELPRTGTVTPPMVQIGLGLCLLGAGALLAVRDSRAFV